MGLFDDALDAARAAVKETYGRAMTLTAMTKAGDFKPAAPDPNRPPLTITGTLHEHVTPSASRAAEDTIIERSDGDRPGTKFGVDLAAAPTRIGFDVADLGGWMPPEGTIITMGAAPGIRTFRVSYAGPQNAGRITFYVTEVVTP